MSSEQGPRAAGMGVSAIDAGGRQLDFCLTTVPMEAEL